MKKLANPTPPPGAIKPPAPPGPPSPGNVPITITRGAPITIRVGGLKITIEEEQGHEAIRPGSKITV